MNIRFFRLVQTATFASLLLSVSISANENPVATVNGAIISDEVLGMYGEKRIGVRPGTGFPAAKRKELIAELINRELIYQDAMSQGINDDKFVKLEIEEQIHNLITRARIGKLLKDNPPTEEMLKEIYKTQIVAPASSEYKASHILVETMETAKSIIEQLNKGAKFEALAKTSSTGPSATNGGDLGWFSPNQMAQSFSEAVEKLKPGEFTKRPVKTRFGWHIIRLEESRQVDPPLFESVQEQILKVAQNKIINEFISGLKKSAKIEVHEK